MDNILILLAGTFAISMVTGFFCIPQIIDYCKRKRLFDLPDARKVHHSAIPRLGGISFLPSMLLSALIMFLAYEGVTGEQKLYVNPWVVTFLISLLIIYCVGLIDDILGLAASTKFVFQLMAAALLPLSGLYLNDLYGFCGIHEIPFWVGFPLTVLCIAFIDNAINLIDGIDGLSSGLALMALALFLYGFASMRIWTYCVIIVGLMGILVAYMYYNIWGNADKGTKIFMGDSGSLTLGFMLSFLMLKFSMHRPDMIPDTAPLTLLGKTLPFAGVNLLFAYTLLIVPTFDVVRVILVRLSHHVPIFSPDKRHIHHKMLAAGLTQHQALLAILGLQLFFIVLNFLMIRVTGLTVIVCTDVAIFTLFNVWLTRQRRHED